MNNKENKRTNILTTEERKSRTTNNRSIEGTKKQKKERLKDQTCSDYNEYKKRQKTERPKTMKRTNTKDQ